MKRPGPKQKKGTSPTLGKAAAARYGVSEGAKVTMGQLKMLMGTRKLKAHSVRRRLKRKRAPIILGEMESGKKSL